MKCTYLGHSHETKLFEYFLIEEEKSQYELDDFKYIDDGASFQDQILKHVKELIAEVIVEALHHEMMVISSP